MLPAGREALKKDMLLCVAMQFRVKGMRMRDRGCETWM